MAPSNRQSFLTYEPISFSLTEGTNIPPPQETPPSTAQGRPETISNGDMSHDNAVNGINGRTPHQNPISPSIMEKQERHGIRRLFSLSSLRRTSFSSSRASLALPRESYEPTGDGVKRPHSPSAASFVTAASTHDARPQSRASMRSGRWFKRKSTMWTNNGRGNLASIGEDGRPESKRLRERSPAPLLPDIAELAGGDLKDGHVEWDEKLFKK